MGSVARAAPFTGQQQAVILEQQGKVRAAAFTNKPDLREEQRSVTSEVAYSGSAAWIGPFEVHGPRSGPLAGANGVVIARIQIADGPPKALRMKDTGEQNAG